MLSQKLCGIISGVHQDGNWLLWSQGYTWYGVSFGKENDPKCRVDDLVEFKVTYVGDGKKTFELIRNYGAEDRERVAKEKDKQR